jgi:Flp pilus assembly protein TadD
VREGSAWFAAALEKAPDDLGLLGEYAATLGEAGEYRAMLRVARRMVELDPQHPRAYFLQAVLAARAGRDDLARRLLWRTEGAYDDVPSGQLLAGILELRTGNPALAAGQFDALARRQPDNARVALLLGRALLAAGDAGEVVARFGPAAARADAPPYLLTLVGRAYEQLGRRAEAAPYLDRAATGVPATIGVAPVGAGMLPAGAVESAGAAVPLLRTMLGQGRGGEARAFGARLGEHYRGSADVERLRGDTALLTGDPGEALAHYAAAARIRRDWSLVERMAAAERLRGRGAAALALVGDHVARNPADGRALALLGRMLAERGESRRAASVLAQASALGGGDPLLLADLARAELAAGDADAAREAAQRAYALQRSNGRVAEVLARTLQAGEPRLAEVLLAKSRALAAPPVLTAR